MKKENIEYELTCGVHQLLEMARDFALNSISSQCLYIMSEIQNTDTNVMQWRKIKKRENEKNVISLLQVVSNLHDIYQNLYDINLYIYKSTPNLTVIEVRYYLKSSLNSSYFEKVKDNEPMLHCKIIFPPYLKDDKSKFDINWPLGGLKQKWKLFFYQQKLKLKNKNL